jgi:hypothetical protein
MKEFQAGNKAIMLPDPEHFDINEVNRLRRNGSAYKGLLRLKRRNQAITRN